MSFVNVVPAVSNEASGPSYSVVRLCESLISAGKDVTLAALDWAPIAYAPHFLKTFPIGMGPRRLGRSLDMARWLESEALNRKLTLIHNHGMWQMNAVYTGRVAERHGIPSMVSPRGAWSDWAMSHGSVLKKIVWPLVQKPSMKFTSCFHATALSEYDDIRRLGFDQPIAVIPNGVDIPDAVEKTEGVDRTLLFLGRIHPKKGLDLLLPAWKILQSRFPEWRLRIVGDDKGYHSESGYLQKMRILASRLSLQRIEFIGSIKGEAKWRAYSEADLFVLPTYSENFGMSVAESLASGTPAIVTKGAPWQGLEKHNAGKWIEIGIDSLISAMEELMSQSPQELGQMGLKGRDWMISDFSWQKVGHEMSEVYDWICGKTTITPSTIRTD